MAITSVKYEGDSIHNPWGSQFSTPSYFAAQIIIHGGK